VGEQPPLRSIRSSLVSTQMKCKLWNESHRAGWEWTKMKERQRMRAKCANATARDDGDECRWGGEEKILRADPGRARSPGRWSPTVTCRAGRRPYYSSIPGELGSIMEGQE
jgi:hypothetical protein